MLLRKKIGRILLAAAPAGILFAATAAYAQTAGFAPLADSAQSPMLSGVYNSKGLAEYVNAIFTTALSVGAILAVLRIAYAGYKYMTTDAWGSKSEAKEILGDVVLGILLLLSIYLILRQINPDLLKLDVLTRVTQSTAQ